MGFLDKLKQDAAGAVSTVAEKTQEMAKAGQLQVHLRNLRGDERDALVEFGREAYNLLEAKALAERSGELAGAAAKIADIREQIFEKEQEIAAARSRDGDSDSDSDDEDGDGATPAPETVEGSAEEVPDPAAAAEPPPTEPAAAEPPPADGAPKA
jgi:hypothetical protein